MRDYHNRSDALARNHHALSGSGLTAKMTVKNCQGFCITRLRMSSAGFPVGFHPCSTAFKRRFCRAAFAGVVAFALTPPGVRT